MAALAFGLIGAWAAPAVGLAASTGWAIGSYLGGAIFRPTVRIEGPRLQDTKVQVSTYGTAIPIVYGAMRIAGNVIDMSEIREHSTTKKQRGKGGGTKYTTYTYEADVAVALCEGGITGVAKIWANGELIYSIAEDATIETVTASNKMAGGFTVYQGTETQMPDAALEALHGAGNVPAYRGIAYVVFSTLWLEKYGNRLPNFEFEVVAAGATPPVYEQVLAQAPYTTLTVVAVGSVSFDDVDVDVIQFHKPQWTASYATDKIAVYEARGMDVEKVGEYSVANFNSNLVYGDTDVSCYATVLNGYGDPDGGFGMRFHDGKMGVRRIMRLPKEIYDAGFSSFCRRGDTVYVVSSDCASLYKARIGGAAEVTQAVSFGYGGNLWLVEAAGVLYISKSSNNTLYKYDADTLAPLGTLALPAGGNTSAVRMMCRDVATGALYVRNTNTTIHKLSGNAWELVVAVLQKSPLTQKTPLNAGGSEQPFGAHGNSFYRVTINDSPGVGQTTGIFVTQAPILLGKQTVPLGSIVQDLCARVGLTAIDKTALDSTQVAGYVMGRQAAVRGAIEPLQSAYFFDAVESGGVLKFVKRGGAPVASIPLDDLCAGIDQADSGDPLAVVRAQEVDLPQQVTISYSNLDAAYQTSAEIAQRIVTPSVNKVGAELPIAMTATQAARIADAWMYQAYAGRTSMKFKLSREYAALEPCDVVTVTDGAQTFTARITSKMDEGGVYAFEAENENGIKYNSNAQGAGNVPPVSQISLVADSVAELIDTAIMRDADNDAGFYAALAPRSQNGRWGGAVLLTGSLSDPTNELGGVTRMGVVGTILNALPATNLSGAVDAVQAPNFFDESIFIDVQLNRGELESKSVAEIFSLENAAVIGDEIIQFRDAVLTGDRRYRLTGILRGRRGTEDLAAVSKPVGTRFVLLSGEDGILRPDLGTLGIGVQGGYRAVTIGGIVQNAPIELFTNNARGLKPYAPRRAFGWKTATGVSYRWTRRSRIDGGWRNGVNVPIGEAVEEYAVYMRATGGALIATFSSAVQSLTLTTAQITAAFNAYDLANGGTISRTWIELSVAQVSATVGAGLESPVIRITL